MPIDKELAMTEAFPQALLDTLRRAQRITVLTGAGISAESGLLSYTCTSHAVELAITLI